MKPLSSNIANVTPTPGAFESPRAPRTNGAVNSEFHEQLQALRNTMPSQPAAGLAKVSGLKFSNHAVDRMRARGISFSPEQMARIENAVGKAAGKGAKDTLLLTDTSALIVSVKDNTVVTVMDKTALKENVFTKIDSAVMI